VSIYIMSILYMNNCTNMDRSSPTINSCAHMYGFDLFNRTFNDPFKGDHVMCEDYHLKFRRDVGHTPITTFNTSSIKTRYENVHQRDMYTRFETTLARIQSQAINYNQ
jgi:hypothetical protein